MALIGLVEGVITDGTTHALDAAYSYWTVARENGLQYLYTTEWDPTDTDAEFSSPAIPGDLINGRIITVMFWIGTAGANVGAGWQIEGSFDGKSWVRIGSELSADLAPDLVGGKLSTVDLTNYTFPWYRMTANDDVTDLTTIEIGRAHV